ncbi:pleckstrin homology domain-containing family H member 3 isoform X2 [Anas acuta]|uniref:pleckstrin homology domain-containing family H member 3 isoform X2 n=1 Tax=Anas acuta TaxID=28680 RepID=UPI0035C8E5EF
MQHLGATTGDSPGAQHRVPPARHLPARPPSTRCPVPRCRCPHRAHRGGRVPPNPRRARFPAGGGWAPGGGGCPVLPPQPRSAARPRPVDDANGGPAAPGALAPPRAVRGDWRGPVTRRGRPARGGGGGGGGAGPGGGGGGRCSAQRGRRGRARRGDAVPRRALVAAVLPAGLHAAAAGLRRRGPGGGRRGRGGGVLRAPSAGRPGVPGGEPEPAHPHQQRLGAVPAGVGGDAQSHCGEGAGASGGGPRCSGERLAAAGGAGRRQDPLDPASEVLVRADPRLPGLLQQQREGSQAPGLPRAHQPLLRALAGQADLQGDGLLERDGVWQEALLPPVQRAPQRGRALGVRGAEGHRQQGARADAHPAAHARRRGALRQPRGPGADLPLQPHPALHQQPALRPPAALPLRQPGPKRPRSTQLHHAARRGREALQLAAAAGVAAGPGAADPGHPADLPGPAAAGGRDLLPAGEADHGAAGAGRAGRLALLAAAHLHELHVPALPACPALPALPPGQDGEPLPCLGDGQIRLLHPGGAGQDEGQGVRAVPGGDPGADAAAGDGLHRALPRRRRLQRGHQLPHHGRGALSAAARDAQSPLVAFVSPQVARELVSRLGLSQSPNLFALYEQSRLREQPVGSSTLLADVLTSLAGEEREQDAPCRLCFKHYGFLDTDNVPRDSLEFALLFEQAHEMVLRGYVPTSEETLQTLAALRLQSLNSDFSTHAPFPRLEELFPPHVLHARLPAPRPDPPPPKCRGARLRAGLLAGGLWGHSLAKQRAERDQRLRGRLREEGASTMAAIVEKWKLLQGMGRPEAMAAYVALVREWPGFGSTLFDVDLRASPVGAGPQRLWLGIGAKAVSLYKPGEPEPLDSFCYGRISSFGASDSSTFRLSVEDRDLLFETSQVDEIAQLLTTYLASTAARRPPQEPAPGPPLDPDPSALPRGLCPVAGPWQRPPPTGSFGS